MKIIRQWDMVTVAAIRDVTPTIREFTLDTPWTEAHEPGAHLQVEVLIDGRIDTRSYSLVGAADGGRRRIAVKLLDASRGGSRYMWGLGVGARIKAAAPANHFALSRQAPAYLLVAGGIGITPILTMAEELVRRGATVSMIYGARDRAELAYGEELRALLGDRLRVFLDAAGERPDLGAAFAALPAGAEVYVCGPIAMLEAAKRQWAVAGRPRANLRFETFGSSGRFANQPFTARLPRLGVEVVVPENATLLETLEAAGVGVLSDCRRGECGLCVLDVTASDGAIDHRDVFLSDEEHAHGQRICACVSRLAGGSVTLEPAYRGDVSITPSKVFG